MTEQSNTLDSRFLRSVGNVLRFLLRFLFVLVIGTLIGVGLFYGVPWVYQRLVWPVQENSARVAILEEQVEKNSDNIVDHHRALQNRIVDLENDVTDLREQAASQAEDQEVLREESQQLGERIIALENELEARVEDLERSVQEVRSDFSGTTTELQQEIDGIEDELEAAQRDIHQEIRTSEENLADLEGQVDEVTVRLSLLQTAQDLLKVRLLLVEENPGVARDTLELAIAHLDRASELLPSRAEVFAGLRERLLSVDDLIVDRSFRARPTLEALWADVMDLAMPLTAQSPVTGTQTISPPATPTPAP